MKEAFERTMSAYSVSIGTCLALESITNTGEFEGVHDTPPVNTIDRIYLNLRTLVRNAINAFESKDQYDLNANTVIECVEEDFEEYRTTVMDFNSNCEVVLYLCDYRELHEVFPYCKFKNASTAKQNIIEAVTNDVLRYYQEEYKDSLIVSRWKLEGAKKRCVIQTHLPLDLMSHKYFSELKLLESHTGKIKERREWHTKIHGVKDVVIPLNLAMLQIFGDGTMISPQDLKARKMLVAIADKRGWHPMTTNDKIISDIKLEHEPYLYDFYRRYSVNP